jgi:hypothetical protein
MFEQFPSAQTEVPIYGDEDQVVDKLRLDENDPIFATTYKQMISESFAEGKHFFLARVISKSLDAMELTQNHSQFFNAYGILKLLFKRRQNELVGRFHERYPISVKNPITNSVSSNR